jgi:glycosyltransferase involved in cell wall biosynthesis
VSSVVYRGTLLIRVLALLPYPLGRAPGQRYRIEQWAPRLRAEGIELTLSPFLSPGGMDVLYRRGRAAAKVRETVRGSLRRLRELLRPGGHDVVYVYREAAPLGPAWIEARLGRRLPLVFDFDDAIYLPAHAEVNAAARFLKHPGKVAHVCRLARHVTVGNETLAGFARRHASAVTVIPSTIDTEAYAVRARGPNTWPVVGWTGSLTTLPYLRLLSSALARLRKQVDFELRVIGGELEMPGVDVRCRPWRADTEVEDLRPFDVGLMPLPDDEWTRGKGGMKALQYMGLAIPPVVSPVGANAAIVEDGVNGFHARTEDEWVDRIARLLRDAGLRARLGAAGRRTVEETYSAAVQAPRMALVLREAAR